MRARGIADGWLTIDDVRLETFHNGEGPALLFLHGGGGLDHHAPFLEMLADRYEVIAPSHPGFGRSPLPDRFDGVDDLAYLYLDLLDELDLRDVILAGCSLGGWIAAEVAVRCAHRLSKLALAGPVGIKVGDRETRDIPDIFALAPNDVAKLAFHDPAKAVVDYGKLTDEELRTVARNRESLALYTWEPYMHNPKLRHHLGRIRIPTMLIRGADDGLISRAYLDAYAAPIRNSRVVEIEGAGHSPEIEQPEEFVRTVASFAG